MARRKKKALNEEPAAQKEQSGGEKNRQDKAYVPWSTLFYDWLYWLGLSLMRMFRRQKRRLRRSVLEALREIMGRQRELRRRAMRAVKESVRVITSPGREIPRRMRQMREELETEKRYGTDWSVFRKRLHITGFIGKRLWSVLRVVFNYTAPVVACLFLWNTLQDVMNSTYALRLEYNGEELGYIQDETVFRQAQNAMQDRLASDANLNPADLTPVMTLERVQTPGYLSVDDLTNTLISFSGSTLVEADGFYLETTVLGQKEMQLVGVLEDGNGLLSYLSTLLDKYRSPDDDDTVRVQFLKRVQVKRGLFPQSAVRSLDSIKRELDRLEAGEQNYTVVSGDTPIIIAAKNGIELSQLRALNPDVDTSLFPGDTLIISQEVPKMGVQVTKSIRYEEEMEYRIQQETVPSRDIGWTNLKQKGEQGLQEVVADVVLVDGIEVSRTVVSMNVVREPVPQILQVGGNRPLTVIPQNSSGKLPSGAFAWPAAGGRITVGFRGYWGHTGSDISFSGCYGTPVYASANGTVVSVRYDTYNYGYHVLIAHGGGVQTLYAHCSRLDVTVGQQVTQGDVIGAIGSTGRSTGPHLHFEIRINGTQVDAAPYLYGQK